MHGHLRHLDSSQFLCPQHRTRLYTVGVNAMHTRELPREPRLLSAGPARTFLDVLHPGIEPFQEDTLSTHLKVNLLMYKHILQEHRVSLACLSLDRGPRADFGPYFRTDGLIPTLRMANHPARVSASSVTDTSALRHFFEQGLDVCQFIFPLSCRRNPLSSLPHFLFLNLLASSIKVCSFFAWRTGTQNHKDKDMDQPSVQNKFLPEHFGS